MNNRLDRGSSSKRPVSSILGLVYIQTRKAYSQLLGFNRVAITRKGLRNRRARGYSKFQLVRSFQSQPSLIDIFRSDIFRPC